MGKVGVVEEVEGGVRDLGGNCVGLAEGGDVRVGHCKFSGDGPQVSAVRLWKKASTMSQTRGICRRRGDEEYATN